MKLLTKKETDKVFKAYQFDSKMNSIDFNTAVNALLMDAKIVKSLLSQAKRIKEEIK